MNTSTTCVNNNFNDDDFLFEIYNLIPCSNTNNLKFQKIFKILNYPKKMYIGKICYDDNICYLGNGILLHIKKYLETLGIYAKYKYAWDKFCGCPYIDVLYCENVNSPIDNIKFEPSFVQYCNKNNIDINKYCDYDEDEDEDDDYENEDEEDEDENY